MIKSSVIIIDITTSHYFCVCKCFIEICVPGAWDKLSSIYLSCFNFELATY